MISHPDLPQNIEAEQAAIGACLINPDAANRASVWLTAPMFFYERNALIWSAILSLCHRHEPISIKTVLFELRKLGTLDDVGGLPYLSGLSDNVISTQIEQYAAEVERCATRRALVSAGGKIAALGHNEQDAEKALGDAQKLLAEVMMKRVAAGLLSSPEAADREYARMELANSGQLPAAGVRTGFRDLDELLLGLNDSDLLIVAARPSLGKTSFLLSLAHGVADQADDRDVLIFSLEMAEEQLRYRRLAMLSRIDTMRIRALKLNEADQQSYMRALGTMSGMPVYVDDTPAVSVAYVRAACYRHQAQHGRKLVVFVDYLQLMTAQGERLDNRVQAVSEISRSLKALAKELDCPVVALSQLSRSLEARQSKIPMLADLRESGGIEQDADVVMFIYRDEVYNQDTDQKGIAQIHIAKHRSGPTGVVPMRWDALTTTFQTLTYRQPEGY